MESTNRVARAGTLNQLPVESANGKPATADHATIEAASATLVRLLANAHVRQPESKGLQAKADNFDPESAARELLSCINGPEFNLADIDPALAEMVLALPPEAWEAFDRHAHDVGRVGIATVRLGAQLSAGDDIVQGLKQLPALKGLIVESPTRGPMINFGALQGQNRQGQTISLERVTFHGDAPRELHFRVPVGVSVEATGQSKPSLWKSLVHYTDADGKDHGEARPVHGQIHDRKATDFQLPNESNLHDAQGRADEVRLNIKANFVGLADLDAADMIVCRHLVAQWLDDRGQHEFAPEGERFSYMNYKSETGITQHVPRSVETELERMVLQGSCAVSETDQFGAMVALRFNGMETGESRRFAVSTGAHLIGLELQVKEKMHGGQMRREYVVKVYDPTRTATHTVMSVVGDDLSSLGTKTLADWVGDDHVDEYFANRTHTVVRLYDWPPGPARKPGEVKDVSVHVSDETITTPGFLHAALDDGHVALVQMFMEKLRLPATWLSRGELMTRLLAVAGLKSVPGLYFAANSNSPPEVVEEYVKQVLAFPASTLDSAARLTLLQARVQGVSALSCAMENGRSDMALRMVRAVLADTSGLTRGDRQKFLQSLTASGQPVMSTLCATRPSSPVTELQVLQYETMQAVMTEIVRSPALSDAEKESLVSAYGGPHGREECGAPLALQSGNPGAAAAMLLAVLEAAPTPALKTKLMAALGVTPAEVLPQLSQVYAATANNVWLHQTIVRIEAQALE